MVNNTDQYKTCCQYLRNLLSNAGQKGVSAIITSDSTYAPVMYMQFRSCNYDDLAETEKIISSLPDNLRQQSAPLALAYQTALNYCPVCGKNLKKWLKKNRSLVEELNVKHHKFLMGY